MCQVAILQSNIYFATNELLTEALVIRDGRSAALRDSFVVATNQKQMHFAILAVMVHCNVHRVQFLHVVQI